MGGNEEKEVGMGEAGAGPGLSPTGKGSGWAEQIDANT